MNVCPVHTGTTVDNEGRCAICDLEERLMAKPTGINDPRLRGSVSVKTSRSRTKTFDEDADGDSGKENY